MADLGTGEIVARVLLAAGLGAAIGFEREADGHEAGLRTHLMLALGAAVFGLISVGAWDWVAAERETTNFQVDVSRVASYVAAGIGFIGGGAILKHGANVRGLTTAASLWVAAAVGLACGVGFILPAVVAAGVGLVSLVALRPLRAVARRLSPHPRELVVVVRGPGPDAQAIVGRVVDELPARALVRISRTDADDVELLADVRSCARDEVRDRFERLVALRTALPITVERR